MRIIEKVGSSPLSRGMAGGTSSFWLFTARILGKPGHSHLFQNSKQRAELGKTRLEQVQSHKAGEPEPVGAMKMGQEQGDDHKCSCDNPYDAFDIHNYILSL